MVCLVKGSGAVDFFIVIQFEWNPGQARDDGRRCLGWLVHTSKISALTAFATNSSVVLRY